jgi:peptide/nickel transport system substrate-binding protein
MDKPDAGIGTGAYKIAVNEPGVRHVGEKYAGHWNSEVGHVDSIEIIVINDATARTAALQSGKVHMINRVEPKIVSLVKRIPGVTIENIAGRGHYVFIMHTDTAPFDNVDLRMALKLAMDREKMVKTILRGYGTVGNDMPINSAYPLFSDDIPQRMYDPEKAKFHFKKSGHSGKVLLRTSDVAFPGAVDAAQLYQQSAKAAGIDVEIKREPGDGYWSNVWNKQPFCESYWGGRPVQDQMYSTAYLSTADWNDTKWKRPAFDKLLLAARAELDTARRKAIYREMGMMVRDDGGLICPMFNDFIDARSDKLAGYVGESNGELMNGFAGIRCWIA